MAEHTEARRLPPLPGLIAGGLVILGLLLSAFVAEGLLVVRGWVRSGRASSASWVCSRTRMSSNGKGRTELDTMPT